MKIAQIQFTPWDKAYYFNALNFDLKKGDKVVVETSLGTEVGEVVGVINWEEEKHSCQCPNKDNCSHGRLSVKDIKPVLRFADHSDLAKGISREEKENALDYCKGIVEKFGLEMKIVDAHFSYDNSKITFAFIAEARIDFRELVKELAKHFNKTIRLHQIGIRDEAKLTGDCGPCGKPLCCRGFLKDLASITSEMADLQQCAHRGSERLSGVCGRLKCCLAYEQKGYEELAKNMPAIGAKVNVDGKRGVVLRQHTLKQSVDVEFPPEKGEDRGMVVEVDLNRNKN
jgi:cell fate regulator YaaT (PSP1 superfamily)